ncbi:MAG: hypothetical protein BWY63_02644 [Chloroflexi bacterium ADurb.Bin360]|nr:MAG: hypothetical protein BWY63_02644 [Chloroflexi bacterium ADurb.Bin360]
MGANMGNRDRDSRACTRPLFYDPEIHHRRSIRLPGYDYSQAGAYFVTLCTQGRTPLFGGIVDGTMRLNEVGTMVQSVWQSMPDRFPSVIIDVYVIMPNHFHAIVIIDETVGATLVVAQADVATSEGAEPGPALADVAQNGSGTTPGLGNIVGAFKSITTVEYISGVRTLGWQPFERRIWQRNYWEHIIRNEESYARIADYIVNNPANWKTDQLYPDATPNPFNRNT